MNPRPLSEKELEDWERWVTRGLTWKSEDVARLLATVRELQRKVQALESESSDSGD